MRKAVVGIALSFLLFSCAEKEAEKVVEEQKPVLVDKIETTSADSLEHHFAQLSIGGMTCEMGCAKTIQNELNHMSGVLKAEVMFEDSTANIEFDASTTKVESIIESFQAFSKGKYSIKEAIYEHQTPKGETAEPDSVDQAQV